MFKHVSPTQNDRMATAPYNFIPLPQKVWFAPEDSVETTQVHDRFAPNTMSGYIDLEMETLTPLFIRGAVRKKDGKWTNGDVRMRSEPFLAPDGRPVIPGSSIRGVIRNIFEVLTFSKLQPVTDEQPFYRSVGVDRMAAAYRNRMLQKGKPRGGFAKKQADGSWVIEESSEILRVHHSYLPGLQAEYDKRNSYNTNNSLQHKKAWVRATANGEKREVVDIKFDVQESPGAGWVQAVVLLTGWAPERKDLRTGKIFKKEREFAFLTSTSNTVRISDEVWKRFHDDDQITQWQAKSFPKKAANGERRKHDGDLADGDPVFFIFHDNLKSEENPAGLFFGRAQMFRLPYDFSPSDLLPTEHRDAKLDLAETVFGFVPQVKSDTRKAIKGRVQFQDAIAESCDCIEREMVPQILSGPKVTTYQHYLTQNDRAGQYGLTTYLAGDRTTIRGHKFYWHRWNGLDSVRHPEESKLLANPKSDTQTTRMRPVKSGTRFVGRIRFENLLDYELGALLASVALPDECALKFGMGKPLGFGSVKLRPTLYLCDRHKRYSSWTDPGFALATLEDRVATFSDRILAHAQESKEPLVTGATGLDQVARLNCLFMMLNFEQKPRFAETRYMTLPEYQQAKKSGKILPSPNVVKGSPEPLWGEEVPVAAPKEADMTPFASVSRGSSTSDRQADSSRSVASGVPRSDSRSYPGRSGAPAVKSAPSGPEIVSCVADRQDPKGRWIFKHVNGPEEGMLQPPNQPLPGEVAVGTKFNLIIRRNGDKTFAFSVPRPASGKSGGGKK
jgi:CRISPR-associated protein (TIGR03986 family)